MSHSAWASFPAEVRLYCLLRHARPHVSRNDLSHPEVGSCHRCQCRLRNQRLSLKSPPPTMTPPTRHRRRLLPLPRETTLQPPRLPSNANGTPSLWGISISVSVKEVHRLFREIFSVLQVLQLTVCQLPSLSTVGRLTHRVLSSLLHVQLLPLISSDPLQAPPTRTFASCSVSSTKQTRASELSRTYSTCDDELGHHTTGAHTHPGELAVHRERTCT